MEQRIFEGTWEDLLSRASEFSGQRVRLTVISNETESSAMPISELLKGRVGKVNFQPSDLSERTREAFAEFLEEKHFDLNETDDAV
jgi:hypothetical protein